MSCFQPRRFNRGNMCVCGCGRVSQVFVACWSAALCLEFRKFLLGALHLLAPPWTGYCPKADKERMLKCIMGSNTNFKYGQLLCFIAVLGFIYCVAARKEPILMAVRLKLRSAAARLMGLQVRIPSGALISVCCGCCVLWDKDLGDGLIPLVEASNRVCVCVVDHEQVQQ